MELVGRVADSAGVALLVIADKTDEISGGLCDEPASGMQNGKRISRFVSLVNKKRYNSHLLTFYFLFCSVWKSYTWYMFFHSLKNSTGSGRHFGSETYAGCSGIRSLESHRIYADCNSRVRKIAEHV